jgi:cytochrome c oxidase subunit 2
MTHARTAGGLLAGAVLLVLAADPAAAQTSINSELITDLNFKLLYVAVPITVLVEGILIYTVIRFKDNDDPSPTRENRRLEITWTVATAIILLFVGLASYQVLGSAFIGGATATAGQDTGNLAELSYDYEGAKAPADGENAVQVEVIAQKYFWTYRYPEAGNFTVNPQGGGEAMVIPANRTVYIHVTSTDWLHAFHVPDLALKQDAFPGRYHTIKTVAYEPGGYQLYCAEYCGVGHSGMLGQLTVLPQAENPSDPAEGTYEHWLQEQQGGDSSGSSSDSGSDSE